MTAISHPNEILNPTLANQIRENAFIAEESERLPQSSLELIYQRRWFHVMVPKKCGGAELPLPETVRLFEALAWADANFGWCVNLGAGANMFAGYFGRETAQRLFRPERTCCAGSGAVSGKARKVEGGYLVTGRWKYASGSRHATHFTANAYLLNEDGQPLTKDNTPVFRSFIFPVKDVTVQLTWRAIGLKATSSNDFEVDQVFVPDQHVFSLAEPSAFADGPLYRFPFLQMAVVNTACMLTGIALHFIDLYTDLSRHKRLSHGGMLLQDNEIACLRFQKATDKFYAGRQTMFDLLEKVWHIYEARREADAVLLRDLTEAAKRAAQSAREAINDLYPLCGMSVLNPASGLNKVWRDAATASQHFLLSPLNT